MVKPRGSISAPIWAITWEPSDADKGHGTILSGSEGFHFDKMCQEIGLPDMYILNVEDNPIISGVTQDDKIRSLVNLINMHHPNFLCLLGSKISELLTPETRNYKKPHDCKLDKWAGSLLISPLLNYPHYCIPLWPPSYIFGDWGYRDIYKFIDLGHVKDEYDYLTTNGTLCPLPSYNITTNPSYNQLLDYLDYCRDKNYVGSDIETIRPAKSSKMFKGHPGYFYTISIAASRREAISFSLWDYPIDQCAKIWQGLNYILKYVPQIGQNYIQFDTHIMESLGFEPTLSMVYDTRIRHHLLFPEMPHSLQFMCKQYTRQKFYKDDGKQWKPNQKAQLMQYNCLDAMITLEIYEEQEKEFVERPHLI